MQGPRRPSRRTVPLILELESRRLLSGQGIVKALVGSMSPLSADLETHSEAAKTNKQTKFVEGLYKKYLHQAPTPAELSDALALLASGVSRAALTRDFMDLVSKSDKVSNQKFVSALYATIAGVAPTAVGQSYWQGLLTSGDSRTQVQEMFEASHGLLPAPTITWAAPVAITYGTALGTDQLNANRERARYVHLLVPRGHDPPSGQSEHISYIYAQRFNRLFDLHRVHDDQCAASDSDDHLGHPGVDPSGQSAPGKAPSWMPPPLASWMVAR